MNGVERMRADLDELNGTIAELSEHSGSFSASLAIRGLEQARQDLLRDIDDARRPTLRMVVEGEPVVGQEIRVDALAALLSSLQESLSSIAQALTGRATSRAAIPGPLRERTALRLAATFAGSFGATLRAAEGIEDVLPGFEGPRSLLDQSVETVLSLIEMAKSEDVSDDPIVDVILPLGSRSFKHLSDLSATVVNDRMSATMTWDRPDAAPREVTLDRAAARRLEDVLGRNKLTERQEQIEGRLGTVSDIRNAIELQTDGDILRAKVIEELVPELGAFYTRRVFATFQVTSVRSLVTGVERNNYVLLGLAHTEQPRQGQIDLRLAHEEAPVEDESGSA